MMSATRYWDRRLFEATRNAAEADLPELRATYIELAAHYASMSRLCGTTRIAPRLMTYCDERLDRSQDC